MRPRSVTDLDGGQVLGGDTLEYTILLHNTAGLPATNVVFTDPVPLGTTYVAGSLATTRASPTTPILRSYVWRIGPCWRTRP